MLLYRSSPLKNSPKTVREYTFTDAVTGQYYDTSFDSYYRDNVYFNKPVIIGNKVYSCANMFYGCSNFNSVVTIGDTVKDCSNMLRRCTSFDIPLTIGENVVNCSYMLDSTNFNQNIIVPSSVNDLSSFLNSAPQFSNDIYIKGTTFREINVKSMVYYPIDPKRKNIRFNPVLNNIFNQTDRNSVIGLDVTWTPLTNGFYNSNYNVYCFNDYSG